MTEGLPPKPTCLSIVSGILLAVLVLASFALLPNWVKWAGAVFTFLPSRLGLLDVVARDEVMPVDMTDSPTAVMFGRPGDYALFTANYDLLSINEAVLAAKAKPWFRLVGDDGNEVAVSLIERGLAFYDTPFAKGRPVARFKIAAAGTYTMTHPRRPDLVYVVPDYTAGREDVTGLYMLLQFVALGAGGWYVHRKTHRPRRIVVPPPPSRSNRERFLAGHAEPERPPRSSLARPWDSDSESLAGVAESETGRDGRDVLRMAHEGEMTLQEAEAEVESHFLAQPAGTQASSWGATLALTAPEATAYSQGAGISDLIKLRFEGWPSTCAKCGQAVEYQRLQWWFVRDERGAPGFRHIDCRPKKT